MTHLITKDLRAFLLQMRKNLAILEERQAKYGGDAPLSLLNQIDDYYKAIELTKDALIGDITFAELEEELKPLILDIDSPDPVNSDLEIPPPPEPVHIPSLEEFVAREADLIYFAQKLSETRLAVITGMPGMGNTTMAHMLADFWRMRMSVQEDELKQVGVQFTLTARLSKSLKKIFWHKFHQNEGIESIVWKLAGFLAWNGQGDLWRMLQTTLLNGGQLPPMPVLFDYLFQMLQNRRYLLCFDDFHFVDEDPLIGQIVERLSQALSARNAHIIITSRRIPGFARQMDFKPLTGFSLEETRNLLVVRKLALPEDLIVELQNQTDGNVAFLLLAINALQQTNSPARLMANLVETEDIEELLLTQVESGLNEDERQVMGAIAVLLGYPAPRAAVETVLDQGNLRRVLGSLSERSLIIITEAETGRRVYDQNNIIAAFYYDSLSPSRRREMHRLAAEYYELEEADQLQAALHYIRAGEYRRAAALVSNDAWTFINQGHARRLENLLEEFSPAALGKTEWAAVSLAKGIAHNFLGELGPAKQDFLEALTTLQTLPPSPAARRLMGKACYGLSDSVRYESLDEAIDWLSKGLNILGEDKSEEKAISLLKMSTLQIYAGNYQKALKLINQELQLLPEDAAWLRAGALLNMGMIHRAQGNIEQSIQSATKALDISEQLHDYYRVVSGWNNLGDSKTIAGKWRGAIEAYQNALGLAESMGNVTYQIPLGMNLALLHIRRGKDKLAVEHLSDCLELARKHKLPQYEVESQILWAKLYIHQKDPASASQVLTEAEQLAAKIKANNHMPEIHRLWALVMLMKRDDQSALNRARQSVDLTRELKQPLTEGAALRVLGSAYLALQQTEQAVQAFSTSLALLENKDPYQAGLTKLAWGRHKLALSGEAQDIEMLKQAWITFRKLGARRDLRIVTQLLKSATVS